MNGHDRARAHEVLSVPSRVEILDRLRGSTEPLDAHRLADLVGLHVTTVRFHLSALAEAGLVTETHRRGGGRGRPRAVYTATWAAEPDHGPYQELAEALAAGLDDSPESRAERAEQAGVAWAHRRLGPPPGHGSGPAAFHGSGPAAFHGSGPAADASAVVTAMFTEMGFDPERTSDGRILLHACPFRSSARAHPEVVCGAHRGLLRATFARLDPHAPPPGLHAFVRPDLCVVTGLGPATEQR
ncbi:helix-turn-helix domain-containing protein [Nonomuraea sp. NPDC048916]|uniref:helix-turn-helix transcriptional regulator n=1 Tax=Nonomuraea sp. NPDC048916 TaxID=3154232 RepID=UPI0033DCC7A3